MMCIQPIFHLLLQETKMSNNTQPTGTAPEASAKGMRPEIAAKWGKFSTQEITDLKDKDDLVAQVQSKYGTRQDAGAA